MICRGLRREIEERWEVSGDLYYSFYYNSQNAKEESHVETLTLLHFIPNPMHRCPKYTLTYTIKNKIK